MAALGINVPTEYGRGVAAAGIRALRDSLAQVGSIDFVDDATKAKWMATLLHNRYDCFGMAAIMCPVTRGPGQTLLKSKWTMDPFQTKYPEILMREDAPTADWEIKGFAAAWSGYDFFYGVIYTDGGWAIAEYHEYRSGDGLIMAVESRPDLWTACQRAEIENIAMGLVPNYGWRTGNSA